MTSCSLHIANIVLVTMQGCSWEALRIGYLNVGAPSLVNGLVPTATGSECDFRKPPMMLFPDDWWDLTLVNSTKWVSLSSCIELDPEHDEPPFLVSLHKLCVSTLPAVFACCSCSSTEVDSIEGAVLLLKEILVSMFHGTEHTHLGTTFIDVTVFWTLMHTCANTRTVCACDNVEFSCPDRSISHVDDAISHSCGICPWLHAEYLVDLSLLDIRMPSVLNEACWFELPSTDIFILCSHDLPLVTTSDDGM